MTELLVFGGRNHPNPHQRPAWDRYDLCVLLKIRESDGAVLQRLEYPGWPLDREVGVSRTFRAATIVGDLAYTCTGTQVVKIDLRTFQVAETQTHRYFNDLHQVNLIDGRLFVAATGVDSVLEFDDKFELVKRYQVGTDAVLTRFGPDADYRRIPYTKPHEAHPNFVETWDGELWVTNWEAGRVESLSSQRRYYVASHRIHDGIPKFGKIWFTSVNGAVVRMQPTDGTIETFELAAMTPTNRALGWCRGIAPVGEDGVYVGFSKLRETKLRENLKWLGNKLLKQEFALSEPTHVARYDLAKRTRLWDTDLDEHGMNAVFSIAVC